MIKIIVFLLAFTTCKTSSNCEFTHEGFEESIDAFFEKKIIKETNDNILYVKITEGILFKKELPHSVKIGDKIINLNYKDNGIPQIFIRKIENSRIEEGRKLVSFFSNGFGGVTHKGELVFDCKDGKLKYVDCFFHSSVN